MNVIVKITCMTDNVKAVMEHVNNLEQQLQYQVAEYDPVYNFNVKTEALGEPLIVQDTDNRDPTTTTLILSNGQKVDVDPIGLVRNMIENNYEDITDTDKTDLQNLYDYIKTCL